MKFIRPNCRLHFTADDRAFVVQSLTPAAADPTALERLLADDATQDLLLDDPTLIQSVLAHHGCLPVSPHFYFYVLVRHVCLRFGMADRAVADYVAAVLVEFSRLESTRAHPDRPPATHECFAELLFQAVGADEVTRFYARAHVANASLFLAGLFPDRIRGLTRRRGAPGLSYYDGIGQACYREASHHRLAQRYDVGGVYEALADHFHETRRALNHLEGRWGRVGEAESLPQGLWQ